MLRSYDSDRKCCDFSQLTCGTARLEGGRPGQPTEEVLPCGPGRELEGRGGNPEGGGTCRPREIPVHVHILIRVCVCVCMCVFVCDTMALKGWGGNPAGEGVCDGCVRHLCMCLF